MPELRKLVPAYTLTTFVASGRANYADYPFSICRGTLMLSLG